MIAAQRSRKLQPSRPLTGRVVTRSGAANVLAVTQVVITDCWTHPSGSTVDHQPEATILIALQLDEVVSAAECRKLDLPFVTAHCLQTRVTQRRQLQVPWRRNPRATIPPTSGNRSAESRQDSAGDLRI